MKIFIFVCAFDDSGLDVEVQGVYKSEEKAIEGMMDYFVDTCNYNEYDAKDVVNDIIRKTKCSAIFKRSDLFSKTKRPRKLQEKTAFQV